MPRMQTDAIGIPNHKLQKNLKLNGNYISNDGEDEGIKISNTGEVQIICTDGGDDLKILSSAENDDYFQIQVEEDGETTFTTREDGGGATAHLNIDVNGGFYLDSVGDISLDADGDQVIMKFGSATGKIEFTNENSGDGVIQQKIDTKDLVIKQYDGNEVARFTDAGDVKITNTIYFAAETANTIGNGATGVIDWNVSQKQKVTITGTSITCNFTNPVGPCNVILKVVQGDGNDVIGTWDTDIKWAGGSAPTLSTGNGEIDIISFYFDGTNYFGVASLDFS